MPMASSDWGHNYTDKQIEDLEKRLAKLYKKTSVDARKKMDEHFQRFAEADKEMMARVKSGDLSKNDYNDWRRAQIISGQRWDALSRKLAEDYARTDSEAREIIWQATPDVYAENYNYSTYLVEQTLNVDTSFALYNRDAAKAALTETDFMPRKVKMGTTYHYKKKIQETAVESILLGESVSKLAKRIAITIGNSDMKYATSIARTFMGKAQNQARYDAHGRAKDMGIECALVWLATLDGRTRHSHAALDGEMTGDDGKFENGLRFPCDTENGSPADWMNCRCRTLDVVDGIMPDMSFRSTEDLGGMTYEEWKEYHAAEFEKVKPKRTPEKEDTHNIANGKDIHESWQRRYGKDGKPLFDFQIDDIVDAQGFNGLPRVVSPTAFDRYAKRSNLIMQRTYSAPDQATLDLYRKALYGGKWYIDCSKGGAAFGEGMYAFSERSYKVTDDLREAIDEFINSPHRKKSNAITVETMTMDESAKIISVDDVLGLFIDEVDDYAAKHNMDYFDAEDILAEKYKNKHYESEYAIDIGQYAAARGYDAVEQFDILVVLNRTKLIVRQGG